MSDHEAILVDAVERNDIIVATSMIAIGVGDVDCLLLAVELNLEAAARRTSRH